MASGGKFGTFGGVFTPAILTILGVIMYMRLPWIVGNAGMYTAMGIVVVAHVISVTTGLSVSSMATDKRVKAGGSYYILSRSLGLPIGGTLGIALFIGLSFSVSLYVIGFSESFLRYWEFEPSIDNIRVCGTIVLIAVATVTFISTALAIKTQYFIMAAIAISLVSVFVGSDSPRPETIHTTPIPDGAPLAVIFGIFFPAVTGFEAGVSMSGDLKDPRKSIPSGTIAAIAVGLFSYIGLSAFFAWRIPAEELANNPRVLLDYAYMEELVLPGIWGATISSALGSILGAPRILQASAADGIGPKIFEKGHGPDNEPRNALLLSCFIAWCGILVGELDVIARVVSMFFMTSYGFLNLAAYIEAGVSPDFRPSFRIPRWVSLLGAVVCVGLMIQMDFVAMLAATVAMGVLYAILKRRQLTLESGEVWTGVWASVVRWGLNRLAASPTHERNWRPEILAFGDSGAGAVGDQLASGGILAEIGDETLEPGRDLWTSRASAARFAGLPGMTPNTLLLPMADVLASPGEALSFFTSVDNERFNVVVSSATAASSPGRIDVWSGGRGGNLALQLALVRSLTSQRAWRRSEVRLHLPAGEPSARRRAEQRMARWLERNRVKAELRLVDSERGDTPTSRSADAALILLGLPVVDEAGDLVDRLRNLAGDLGNVLFVRSSSAFADPLGELDEPVQKKWAETVRPPTGEDLLPDPVLAASLADIESQVSGVLCGFAEALADVLEADLQEMADRIEGVAPRLAYLARPTPEGSNRTQLIQRAIWDALASAADQAGRSEDTYRDELGSLLDQLDDGLGVCVKAVPPSTPVTVKGRGTDRTIGAGAPKGGRLDRLRRGRVLHLQTDLARLIDEDVPAAIDDLLKRATHHRLQALLVLHEASVDLSEAARRREDHSKASRLLADWRDRVQGQRRAESAAMRAIARGIVERLAEVIRKVPRRFVRARPATARGYIDVEQVQTEVAPRFEAVDLALQLTAIDLSLRTVFQRLSGGTLERLDRAEQRVRAGVLEEFRALEVALEHTAKGHASVPTRRGAELDADVILSDLGAEVDRLLEHLPESLRIVSEATLARLVESDEDELEYEDIAVRQLAAFLIESELLAGLRPSVAELARTVSRSLESARAAIPLLEAAAAEEDKTVDEPAQELDAEMFEEARGRIAREREAVESALTALQGRAVDLLATLETRLEGAALLNEAVELPRFIRSRQRAHVETRLREVLGQWRASAVRRLAEISLTLDAGWVEAQEVGETRPTASAEALVGFRQQIAPDVRVQEAIPAFYRRAFLSAGADERSWFGGEQALDAIARHVARSEERQVGAVLVTGPPGSGTSSLISRALATSLKGRPVYQVAVPLSATSSAAQLDRAIVSACRTSDLPVDELLRTLPRGAVLVVRDLDLWWLRCDGGLEALERLSELMDAHSDRVLFLLSAGAASKGMFDRLGVFEGQIGASVRVQPLDAGSLMQLVLDRHGTTGMGLRIEDDAGEPGELRLVRYFAALRAHSGGHPGAALASWLAHVDGVDDDAIRMRVPVEVDWDGLSAMPRDWLPTLTALTLHRRLDDAALPRIQGGSAGLAHAKALVRAGLAERRGEVTVLDRFAAPHVYRWLCRQGVLG